MAKRRPPILKDLVDVVMYKAAWACCVCRDSRKGLQVHHIDGDPTNNVEENLVALCTQHHDEAHVSRGLTRTLSPDALRAAKKRWEKDVYELGLLRCSAANNGSLEMRHWSLLHFRWILEVARAVQVDVTAIPAMNTARSRGILNDAWFPVETAKSATASTVYDSFSYEDSHRLYDAFAALVDVVTRTQPPVHLCWAWSRRQLERLAAQNAVCFVNRGFSFSKTNDPAIRDSRLGRYTKDGIRLTFLIDTWKANGVSTLGVHFKGTSRIAALLVLRSAEVEIVNGKSLMVVKSTPLALGTGFPAEQPRPVIAYRDEEDASENENGGDGVPF